MQSISERSLNHTSESLQNQYAFLGFTPPIEPREELTTRSPIVREFFTPEHFRILMSTLENMNKNRDKKNMDNMKKGHIKRKKIGTI